MAYCCIPNSIYTITIPASDQDCSNRRAAALVSSGSLKVVARVGSGLVGEPWMVTGFVKSSTAGTLVLEVSVALREDCWARILLGMDVRV
jgi:hypothetical protein